MDSKHQDLLSYEGCNFFRQRLILSCLSGRPVIITKIRESEATPGVKDFEVSFIRLLDSITCGSKISVNEIGTEVKFKPGILDGGHIEHTCPKSRSIGYFLEPLFMLAPFCKTPLHATLKGITNTNDDPTIDMIRYSLLPVLKKILIVDDGLSLKLIKRGFSPLSGGVVIFTCPIRRSLKAFQWEESGKVKKIRGTAYSSRVAPTITNRILESSKGVFHNFLTDVYFTCDNSKGNSPGYGICLVAETNKGTYYTAESMKRTSEDPDKPQTNNSLPEDIGQEASQRLLEEIYRGGCVDSVCQTLILLFMALGPKDISKISLGPLTNYTMHFLRHLRDFFKVTFRIEEHKDSLLSLKEEEYNQFNHRLLLTCLGVGYSNIAKVQI